MQKPVAFAERQRESEEEEEGGDAFQAQTLLSASNQTANRPLTPGHPGECIPVPKRASNSAFLTFGKIRIRSLPISSLPLLVLLHWDIGNDGEPWGACAAVAAQQMGEVMHVTSGDARYLP